MEQPTKEGENQSQGPSQTETSVAAVWSMKICQELYDMREEESFTDVTLCGKDGVKLKVHSCILAASSPVFKKLLHDHDSSEIMIDASPEVLSALLKLMYCGVLETDGHLLAEIVGIAQYFQIVKTPGESTNPNLSFARPIAVRKIVKKQSNKQKSPRKKSPNVVLVKTGLKPLKRKKNVSGPRRNTKKARSGITPKKLSRPLKATGMSVPVHQDKDSNSANQVKNISLKQQEGHATGKVAAIGTEITEEITDILQEINEEDPSSELETEPEKNKPDLPWSHRPSTEDHICSHCGKICINRSSLISHERIHTGERPYQCPVCSKTFQQQGILNLHTRMQHSNLPPKFACEFCNYTGAESKWKLDMHVKRIHLRQKSWQCEKCGQSFYKKAEMVQHNRAAHLNITYKCDLCDYVGKAKHRVHAHARRVHFRQLNHQCDICGQRFFAKKDLTVHRTIKHTERDEWKFQCDMCNKRFPANTHLQLHKNTHRQKDGVSFVCPDCNRTFLSKAGMTLHYHTMHLKDTVCICKECGKQFSHPNVLKQHMVRHAKAKNHFCGHCDSKFLTKKDLANHQKEHLSEGIVKCQHCHKGFLDLVSLKQHECTVTHIKQEPFPCEFCGQIFTDQSNFVAHQRHVHFVRQSAHEESDPKGIVLQHAEPSQQADILQTELEYISAEDLQHMEVQEIVVPHFDVQTIQLPESETESYHCVEANGQPSNVISVQPGSIHLQEESCDVVVTR